MNFTKSSTVTAQLSEDYNPRYFYFIDGVFFQQKGRNTEKEALKEGVKKLNSLI